MTENKLLKKLKIWEELDIKYFHFNICPLNKYLMVSFAPFLRFYSIEKILNLENSIFVYQH